jgi:hypothetical protein
MRPFSPVLELLADKVGQRESGQKGCVTPDRDLSIDLTSYERAINVEDRLDERSPVTPAAALRQR